MTREETIAWLISLIDFALWEDDEEEKREPGQAQ
jgi:hypothetical protein